MSASTDANRSNLPADVRERLKNAVSIPTTERTEIHQLPRWVKTALVMQAVDGLSYNEAAERMGKAGATLSGYAKSPAAKKWLGGLSTFLEDPVEMAKAYLRGNALSITLERLAFLEAAVAAGDYSEGDKIARDLQDRLGITAQKKESGPSTVVVHLGGGASLEIPLGESRVVDADFKVIDDK